MVVPSFFPHAAACVAALVALSLGACSAKVTRSHVVPVIEASHVRLEVDPSGPWREWGGVPVEAAANPRARDMALSQAPAPGAHVSDPPPETSGPTLVAPRSRGLGEVNARGAPLVKALEEVTRERFLDHPTEVHGESVALYVPQRFAAEVRLSGATVTDPAPGRRIALGGARLVCRELTLVGERITLQTSPDAKDVTVTARGEAGFVSRQRNQVLREEGLRALILANDRVTPLR